MVRAAATLLILTASAPLLRGAVPDHAVAAQEEAPRGPPLELTVADEEGRARVRIGDLLADDDIRSALASGLPLRVGVRVQLWKDGFFDSQVGRWTWRTTVLYDPLSRSYRMVTAGPGPGAGRDAGAREPAPPPDTASFASFSAVRTGVRRTLEPDLEPPEPGRYYYLGRIQVETLSLSDLEELRRWLRGDLADAVTGEEDVEGALGRGLRRALVRMLGVPERRYETRTATFEVGG